MTDRKVVCTKESNHIIASRSCRNTCPRLSAVCSCLGSWNTFFSLPFGSSFVLPCLCLPSYPQHRCTTTHTAALPPLSSRHVFCIYTALCHRATGPSLSLVSLTGWGVAFKRTTTYVVSLEHSMVPSASRYSINSSHVD